MVAIPLSESALRRRRRQRRRAALVAAAARAEFFDLTADDEEEAEEEFFPDSPDSWTDLVPELEVHCEGKVTEVLRVATKDSFEEDPFEKAPQMVEAHHVEKSVDAPQTVRAELFSADVPQNTHEELFMEASAQQPDAREERIAEATMEMQVESAELKHGGTEMPRADVYEDVRHVLIEVPQLEVHEGVKQKMQDIVEDRPLEHGKFEHESADDDCPSSGWQYVDARGNVQGPFTLSEMRNWHSTGFFHQKLMMRHDPKAPLQELGAHFPHPLLSFQCRPKAPRPTPLIKKLWEWVLLCEDDRLGRVAYGFVRGIIARAATAEEVVLDVEAGIHKVAERARATGAPNVLRLAVILKKMAKVIARPGPA